MKMFSIGELSKHTGVKVPTIRYYEKIGLIDVPSRSEGNQRQYEQRGLERLSFIRHARELGFTIEDIKDLVTLSIDHDNTCDKAHNIAMQHLSSVKERIAKLKRLEQELKRIETMSGDCQIDECNVIRALADHSLCQTKH